MNTPADVIAIHWCRPTRGDDKRWSHNFTIYSGTVSEIAEEVKGRFREHGHVVTDKGGDYTGTKGSPKALWFDVDVTPDDSASMLWEHAIVAPSDCRRADRPPVIPHRTVMETLDAHVAASEAAWDYITEGRGFLPAGLDSWLDRSEVGAMASAATRAYEGRDGL